MTRAAPAPFTGNAKRDLGEGQAKLSATPAPTAYSLHDPMQPKPSTVQSFGSTSKRFVFKEDTVPRLGCTMTRAGPSRPC
eukprot:m.231869 g.231869  ORF g.231869 m.231869 type:complete len:80 (+) comp54280_c0_seq10:454-693(+)